MSAEWAAPAAASEPFSVSAPMPLCARTWLCRQTSAARIRSRLPASGSRSVLAQVSGAAGARAGWATVVVAGAVVRRGFLAFLLPLAFLASFFFAALVFFFLAPTAILAFGA